MFNINRASFRFREGNICTRRMGKRRKESLPTVWNEMDKRSTVNTGVRGDERFGRGLDKRYTMHTGLRGDKRFGRGLYKRSTV